MDNTTLGTCRLQVFDRPHKLISLVPIQAQQYRCFTTLYRSHVLRELLRIEKLRAAHLDKPGHEERFDRFARLAQSMLNVPMAFVSIVTEHEQIFKGRAGSDLCGTTRDVSFCSHAIQTPENITEVPDATRDPRFVDNPLVTGELHLRYYAGAPIVVNGYTLGTLCVIDTKPRPALVASQRQILQDLAEALAHSLASAQERHDLNVINRELRHRMGNVYALINSLVTLLARSSTTKEELASRLRERIVSLGQTQSLLISDDSEGSTIRRLAEQIVAPLRVAKGPARIHIQTEDDFVIAPRAAFLLTLMLGELATNSAKHGALSLDGGKVDFCWYALPHDRGKMVLEWHEDCGEGHNSADDIARFEHRRRGFGSEILTRILPADLQGTAELTMNPNGLIYRITGLAARLVDHNDDDEADEGYLDTQDNI